MYFYFMVKFLGFQVTFTQKREIWISSYLSAILDICLRVSICLIVWFYYSTTDTQN